jgi:hypothetical protein
MRGDMPDVVTHLIIGGKWSPALGESRYDMQPGTVRRAGGLRRDGVARGRRRCSRGTRRWQNGLGRNLGYEGVLEFQEYHSLSAPAGWLL